MILAQTWVALTRDVGFLFVHFVLKLYCLEWW